MSFDERKFGRIVSLLYGYILTISFNEVIMDEMNRRHALKVLATLVGGACLPSCCLLTGRTSNCTHYQFGQITKPVIDMHAHFFNATDLMVVEYILGPALNDFIGDRFQHVRELLKRISKAILKLIKLFRRHINAKCELNWLRSENACSPNDEYNIISREFHAFISGEESSKMLSVSNDPKDLQFEALLNKAASELSNPIEKKYPAQSTIIPYISFTPDTLSLAVTTDSYSQQKMEGSEAVSSCPGDRNAVFRILAFAARALARRSTNVQAYYDKYSLNPVDGYGVKHVMNIGCDFDFFLGCPDYESSIEDQINVHEEIWRHTSGFTIPVLGVNPWKMYHDDKYASLVDRTLERGIYKGVKLYPSIGYSVTGKIRKGVMNRTCDGLGVSEAIIKEGMEKLIAIADHRKAFITSHTTFSKGAEPGAEALSSSQYWIDHLGRRPTLKVNFGHMGDPGNKGGSEWRKGFLSLMKNYENVYADFGYHNYDEYDVLKSDLSSFITDYGEEILKKITYGSDWYMISKDKGADAYLCAASQNFERAVSEKVIRSDNLKDMFYNNASRFLSL